MTGDERWLPIPGWEGLYEVSDMGRVRSYRAFRNGPRVLRPGVNSKGYRQLALHAYGQRTPAVKVHTLVALAFLGPRPEGMDVRHLDSNKLNNALTNLAYGTRTENLLDEVRNGRHHSTVKTHCPSGHAYDEANTYVYPSGRHRACRTCQGEAQRRWLARQVIAYDSPVTGEMAQQTRDRATRRNGAL